MPEITEAAPAADVSSAPSTGGDSTTLDSLFDSTPSDTSAEPEITEPEQQATEELTEEQPETALEDFDEDAEPPLDADGKNVTVRSARMKELYANHKAFKQISDFAPTVEAARAHYETATDMRRMAADFQSADPASIDSFIGFWGQQSPQGINTLADRLPQYLQSTAPQVYEGLQSKILGDIVEGNYVSAAQSGDPNDLYRAQMFEWTQTGKWRDAANVKAPDPLAEREAKVAQAEQAQQQRQQQEQAAVVKQWTDGTYSHIRTSIDKETDSVLGEAAKKFEAPILQMLKNQIRAEVTERIKADPEFSTNYNIDFMKAVKSQRNDQTRQQLSDLYLSRVRPIIKAVAKPLVSSATKTVVDQNKAVHDRAQQSQAKTATGGGRPVPRSATPAARPGATLSDQIDAIFAST